MRTQRRGCCWVTRWVRSPCPTLPYSLPRTRLRSTEPCGFDHSSPSLPEASKYMVKRGSLRSSSEPLARGRGTIDFSPVLTTSLTTRPSPRGPRREEMASLSHGASRTRTGDLLGAISERAGTQETRGDREPSCWLLIRGGCPSLPRLYSPRPPLGRARLSLPTLLRQGVSGFLGRRDVRHLPSSDCAQTRVTRQGSESRRSPAADLGRQAFRGPTASAGR
jgi:hypothetical protein